mgnify:CR=1 FL=1
MEKNKDNTQDEEKKSNEFENSDKISEKDSNDNNQDSNLDNEEVVKEDVIKEDLQETDEDKLKEEIRILKEEKIRVLAEMENLRKRFDREKIDSIKYGSVNFARDILSPGDNLERALSAINKEEDHPQSIKNLIEGLFMVKKELSTVLEKNGITKIDTLNNKFDPNLHQAMMEIENNDLDEGTVVQEIQTGYMMHDRLLRPAMVSVSKKTIKETHTDKDKDKDKDVGLGPDEEDNKKNLKN